MTPRSILAVCGTCVAVAVPPTALAASPLSAPAPLGPHTTVASKIRADAQAGAVRGTLRVAGARARLRDVKVSAAYKDKLDGLTVPELAAERGRLRAAIAAFEKTGGAPDVAVPAALSSIAACESGANPATDTGNGFYGTYQFTRSTWASVGGTGNPAAASEAEQDRRAAMLLARARTSPWPVCG